MGVQANRKAWWQAGVVVTGKLGNRKADKMCGKKKTITCRVVCKQAT